MEVLGVIIVDKFGFSVDNNELGTSKLESVTVSIISTGVGNSLLLECVPTVSLGNM